MEKRYTVKLPKHMCIALLRDLPSDVQVVASARVLHIDLDGNCWLDDRIPIHFSDEARIPRILVVREKEGYICDLSPSNGIYSWLPEDIPSDHHYAPVIRLEGI